MSYVSLSGLSAAQLDLYTTSNNIANANTFGFKESRAEFGDVYSSSLFTNAKTTPGGGVQANKVAQQLSTPVRLPPMATQRQTQEERIIPPNA